MKTINETFEDKEFESLKKFKGELSWHNFIMLLVKKDFYGNKIDT